MYDLVQEKLNRFFLALKMEGAQETVTVGRLYLEMENKWFLLLIFQKETQHC